VLSGHWDQLFYIFHLADQYSSSVLFQEEGIPFQEKVYALFVEFLVMLNPSDIHTPDGNPGHK